MILKNKIKILSLLVFLNIVGATKADDCLTKTYHDTNNDGKIDKASFNYPCMEDADFEYIDSNFDGVYDTKIEYGIGLLESKINLPIEAKIDSNEEK